jgi:diadenosine tetraphosphate (Ap4A) HIT family hydrolase
MKKQLESVRKQLIQQIEKTFPEDKIEFARNQVLSMSDEQLIDFLQKNRLLKAPEEIPSTTIQTRECVFCSIIRNEIDSYKIDENKDNIAILEINPVSKGHVLIIPKKHLESSGKLPQNTFSLAKKIAKKIKSKLKPKEVQINASNLFGHEIINVLPIYKNENLGSPRYQEKKEVLEKLKKKLEKKPSKKKSKKKVQKKLGKIKETIRVPRRIP